MRFGLSIVVLAQCYHVVLGSGQVSLSLGATPLANNSVVVISDIGDGYYGGTSPLICTTTFRLCCNTPLNRHGEWYYPNGDSVPNSAAGQDFYRGRGYDGTIRLHRRNNAMSPLGTYYCELPLTSPSDLQRLSVRVVSALASSPPSSPTIVSTTPQSTSITITWTQPEGDVVDSYEITYSYQGPCPVVIQFDSGSISGNRRQFTAVDLHGFSNYTITIIASNGAGNSPPVTTTVETLTAAPSGPPQSLIVTSTTPFSIAIQWSEVECREWNSEEITGYSLHLLRYGEVTASVTITGNTTFTATGLTPRTSYILEVAAVSDSGTGPYGMVAVVTTVPNSVGFFLNGVLYGNNSIVTLDEIGEGSATLFCLTNNNDCCRSSDTPRGVGDIGDWFFPNGNTIYYSSGHIFRGRGPSVVTLHRRNNAQASGVFHCVVPDASRITQHLFVGVYPVNAGSPNIVRLLYDPSAATLICTSTGGPATNVTWRKNGAVVDVDGATYHQSQRVLNTRTATYENTLTSSADANFVGNFICTVSNSRESSAKNVTLNGVTILRADRSLLVGYSGSISCVSPFPTTRLEWLDSERRTVRARVFPAYHSRNYNKRLDSDGGIVDITASFDQLNLIFNVVNDSIQNSIYTCRATIGDKMFEENATITVAVPPNAIEAAITTAGPATVGQEYTLECEVSTVRPGLANTPTVTWLHPNGSPVTLDGGISISPNTPSSSSTLTFTPLTTSHAAQYICEGSIESPALDSPLTVRDTQVIIVQIPPPTSVIVIASPDVPFIVDGHPLNLICSIELSEAVDITVNTVWSGPSGTQFTNTTSVATRMTATSYTSTATISSVETSDSGEYTCTATVSSTSPFLIESTNVFGVRTITVKRSLQMFQLMLVRTDDCATWNDDKAHKFETSIRNKLLQEITSRCYCKVSEENLLPGSFSCLDSHNQTTYRSTIIGTQSYSATELVEFIQGWVKYGPTLTIQWYTVKLDSKCPVSISSLGDPACGLGSYHPDIAHCVDVCIARSRPLK